MLLGSSAYGLLGTTTALLYLYTPEIYPTRMRAIGTGLATSWLRLASAAGPAIVGVVLGSRGIGMVFLMFALVCGVGAVAATRMVETRERSLEEIAL
jgi:putative MFS transporter